MFSSVSWQSFLLTMGVLTTLYYLVIGVLYYQKEIWGLFMVSVIAPSPKGVDTEGTPLVEGSDLTGFENAGYDDLSQRLTGELDLFWSTFSEPKPNKDEIMNGLQQLIRRYPSLRESPNREALHNWIRMKGQTQCSIYFDEKDFEAIMDK